MRTRLLATAAMLCAAGTAAADSFGGFAGNEKAYVLGREKACQALVVTAAVARGVPSCHAASTEELAGMSLKTPAPQKGGEAEVKAAAKTRTITITARTGEVLVTWSAPDPVTSIVDVWRSTYGRIVAVEYTVRRAGREVHEVVAFDLGVGGGAGGVKPPDGGGGGPGPPDALPTVDPQIARAAVKARKASGKAAIAAWQKVMAIDPDHSEARYRTAVAYAGLKKAGDAVAALEALVASKRPDAAEWLIEARFDKAFLKLVADPRFRTAVGYYRPPSTPYERLMGLGGQWEQSLTPCDRPEMKLTLRRDRSFRLDFRSVCEGMRETFSMKGTWTRTDAAVELLMKKAEGNGMDSAPCLLTQDGDEDVLTCHVDADLVFEGRPARR